MNKMITASIPIQNEDNLKMYNKKMSDTFDNFIPVKTKKEIINELIAEIEKEIKDSLEKGSYGDSVEIHVKVTLKEEG